MKKIGIYKKQVAALLLLVMIFELVTPVTVYGLTSGPSQPEMKGFEPIGNSDMVDLFSGDFSYNIPLMDVGGYPVNLAYHSGSGMDDEAGWVGYGWGLNVGSLNRQLRGIPDDFNGTDMQERELNMKDHITTGGKFSMTVDLLGKPVKRIKHKKKKRKVDVSLTVSIGVKVDNYRGIGMELGNNMGVSLTDFVAGPLTKKDVDTNAGLGNLSGSLGFSSGSFDGATLSVNASIMRNLADQNEKPQNLSRSIGFGYNSRAGLSGMTLGSSFSSMKSAPGKNGENRFYTDYERGASSYISFNGDTYTPTIDHATRNDSYTFSLHLGPELFVAFPGIGITGFYSKQKVSQNFKRSPAYGYLNSEKGRNDNDALMDFNREKDIPFTNQVKYIPVPIPTYDLFTATSQDGGGQYRLYRGSSGVFFDQRVGTASNDLSLGIELGGGTYFDVGADLYNQHVETVTQKWRKRNNFLPKGDFQPSLLFFDPLYEPAYFKRIGEPVPYDKDYVDKIKGTSPASVHLASAITDAIEGPEASDRLRTKASPLGENTAVLKRTKREVRNTAFSYLNAREAANHALEKNIKDYHPDSLLQSNCTTGGLKSTIARTGGYRKQHHFSEITITGDDGKRSIYGIPVYNTYQEEVSFSIGNNLGQRNKGLVKYINGSDNSTSNSKGRENYFSREKTPPYTTSYLLTAMLSPDYVDATGNGVTDDDLGTAVKFNYTRKDSLYGWRTPYAFGMDTANYNEGFLSDTLDDKANYVYGKKEIWYLHSIESKTMVAQFVLANRLDALGVFSERGAVDTINKLKYLKEIRLFSKADLRLNNNNPANTIPIKVVHFEYDYSLCKGLPNSINNTGKLTLKKVYFTFGLNQKGKLNPYEFTYDTTFFNHYDYRQYDRWGTFKDVINNPSGLNNAEFPYTLQDTALTNQYVSAWQLTDIILPSGGNIHITYESDDYAFVQDKRASQMCLLQGVGAPGSSTSLIGSDYIHVKLPYHINSQGEMLERYFEGVTNLYFKCFLNLDSKGHNEFVPGYAKIVGLPERVNDSVARIRLQKVDGINPIAKAGWQFLRTNLPKYAYPGSENIESQNSTLRKIIEALVLAFGNISELINGYEKRARNKNYGNNINLSKSWVRLCSPTWKKPGGGSRVKQIEISDDWTAMSGAAGANTATYSQVYDYTTVDAKGRTISSGVASYEPLIGNDENPFRQPVRYKQNQFLGLDNYYYIEEPFGESFYPAASVGYSKVSVKSIGSGDETSVNRTGLTVSEFYTAKDYPTIVEVLNLQHRSPGTGAIFKLIGGVAFYNTGLSQGYSVELNDMHGKPKSMYVLNKSGQKISSMEYFYQTDNELAEKKKLRNEVKVIGANGIITDGTISMDVEMFTDMRQQTTNNLGVSIKVSGGAGAILFFPLPFFFPGIGVNYDRRTYRSASTIKIIQRFCIQTRTRKMENGSYINTENLLWDAETGNVLLTKTQNEFDDPIYSFAYPAHWVYDGMGQAYRNLGTVFSGFTTNANGAVFNAVYNAALQPGDELIDIVTADKYWVISSPIGGTTQKRLINEEGNLQQITLRTLKLIRSGRRNMANTGIATIASLNNPIVGDRLDVTQLTKVLDAKATVFSEEWSVPVLQNCAQPVCPDGGIFSEDSSYCICAVTQLPEPPTTSDFDSICARGANVYSSLGSYIYSTYDSLGRYVTTPPIQINPGNFFWINPNNSEVNGPLNRTAIWHCVSPDTPFHEWRGFTTRINVPETATYYIGIGGDNQVQIIVDGDTIVSQNMDSIAAQPPPFGDGQVDRTFKIWHIFPVVLDAGVRTIELNGWNDLSIAGFGAEIYYNTAAEISQADGYEDLNLVFSSRDFRNRAFTPGVFTNYACDPGFVLDSTNGIFQCLDTASIEICPVNYGTNTIINPYYTGILGNWRPQTQFAYHINRENITGNPELLGSTNIRKSGAYSIFNPFWRYNYSLEQPAWEEANPANDTRWIAANEVSFFNTKGLEIENRDALNRYSSALFGYLESLPVAVASNARYREIGYDGFEDYGFTLDCDEDTCNTGHFSFKHLLNGSTISLTDTISHSGKFCLQLNGNVTLTKTINLGEPASLYGFNNGQYVLQSNELAKGFSPVTGKNYVLSFWVKDSSPRNPTTNIHAIVNGSELVSNVTKWPIVEGWKRVEAHFELPSMAANFSLQLQSGGGTVYFDDIRVHPFDAQLKSFAYDPSSQRLWAEMDENNFATFYEYDDEGILIRVKKETERGIMTIRETRSAYRKR